MSCNYYLQKEPPCPHCGREYDKLHIGTSSAGWYFALHVIPELGINTLDDWRNLWSAPGAVILDEYGKTVSMPDMELVITVRQGSPKKSYKPYSSEDEMLRLNDCEWGDYNLLRAKVGGYWCIGHGEGTWSYFIGEFS